MNILFLKDLLPTARAGDVKNVKPGFARNFLIPQGVAVLATEEALQRATKLRAEKIKQIVVQEKEYEEIISKSKNEAKNIYIQAREKTLKDISVKSEVLDKQIDEEIKKAEDEINQLRKEAPTKINKIAIETASELTQKLIGAEVNNSSISAIVDDLFKRGGDKYYGN